MKRIFSFLLAALLLVSAVPMAQATNDYTAGTKVEYTAANNEAYTITVPAQLAPGGSGTVTLSGTWADNRIVTVTADPTVTLKNSIKETDTKTLNVNFDGGISEKGSNTTSQTFTKDISVDDITDALFGTWSGKFNYNVEICFDLKEGYLDGTWKFNETLTKPTSTSGDYIDYTTNGISYNSLSFHFPDGCGPDAFELEVEANHKSIYYSYSGMTPAGWVSEEYRTISFTSEQQVSMDFWNWFTANATRIG